MLLRSTFACLLILTSIRPSQEEYMLHEYLLALWGVPLGEIFDLEKLSKTCKEKGRWTFFVTSSPNHCVGGVSSHGNAMAIF